MSSSKGLKLRFKGDVTEKKKKKKGSKRSRREGEEGRESGEDAGPPDGNEQAWVAVERVTDLSGPTLLYQSYQKEDEEDSQLYCLALNPALHRVEAHPLKAPVIDASSSNTLDLDGAAVVEDFSGHDLSPTDVNQVWVATRVLDTPSDAPRYTLRSSESRFLTSERSGGVGAIAEARGPLEEWKLVNFAGSQFCLQSANDTLLGLDEMAGGKMVVRSDFEVKGGEEESERAGPSEQWQIRVQWKFREQARIKEQGEKPLRERDSSFKRVKA
ncbi:hypothetical protein CBS101457_003473 [Exobasidium rhododendri]|nr:hypothetical protein CBS101457_003473 [Exobasidium rhododendri]